MTNEEAQRVLANPTFQRMAKKKAALGWTFTFLMLAVYFAYISYIGMSPDTFGTPVSEGSYTTWGIYCGLFVIFFAVAITGIYVYKANGEFERLTKEAIEETGVGQAMLHDSLHTSDAAATETSGRMGEGVNHD